MSKRRLNIDIPIPDILKWRRKPKKRTQTKATMDSFHFLSPMPPAVPNERFTKAQIPRKKQRKYRRLPKVEDETRRIGRKTQIKREEVKHEILDQSKARDMRDKIKLNFRGNNKIKFGKNLIIVLPSLGITFDDQHLELGTKGEKNKLMHKKSAERYSKIANAYERLPSYKRREQRKLAQFLSS